MGLGICYSKHDPGHLRNQQVSLTPPLSTHTTIREVVPSLNTLLTVGQGETSLPKSPYVTISSRLFVQASFATTSHSLQNLNIKACCLPSSFDPHWRRTWSFVMFVLPEVFQASLWAFPWSYFCFRCPTISSRGIHPPLHTSMELTEACIFEPKDILINSCVVPTLKTACIF